MRELMAIIEAANAHDREEIVGMAGDVAERVKNPFNACKPASKMLAAYLEDCGYESKIIRCSGLNTYAPNADKRWTKLGKQMYWVHYVVICSDMVIDITRRQFFPDAPAVFVQTPEEFRAEWMDYSVVAEQDWKQW